MKKITLLLTLILISYTTIAQQAFGFLVEENWVETCNQPDNAGSLTFEDFMTDPTVISSCGVEISSTGDACFPAGELQEGFSITAESNGQITFAPVGTINNTIPLVGASSPTQFLIVNFDRPNINRVAFQLFTQQTNLIDVRVFDTNGDLINNLNINISTAFTNTFYGISATASIGRLEIEQITMNPGFLLIGEMRFGNCVEDCTSTPFFPEGSFPFNIEIDPGSTFTADCDNAPNLIPITVNRAGTIGVDAALQAIALDIEHTFTGDLDISIISPAGTELLIVADQGGGVDNGYQGTQFADDAGDITEATAPYGQAFFAFQGGRFDTTFFGESITGDWLLKICDDAGGDTGQVLNAIIAFCAQEEVNPPVNDLIENAIDVDEIGFPYTDSNINFPDATADAFSNTNGCDGELLNVIWYKLTAIADGTITASFEDSTNTDNKTIIFYSADNENATNEDLTFVNSGTNSCGFNLDVFIEAEANQTYYLLVNSDSVQTINIDGEGVLSTEENTIEGFSFFPNPVQDVLNVQSSQTIDQVTLYNIAGQKVLGQNIVATNSQLHLGNLTSGIYLMTVTSGENTSTYKVIKQ